ncbi:putative alpha-L-fucosidase [Paramyrothecium foliicola]|nr:putative alpha-L-fucosidase [Paramyrothecium foliicola]
MRDRNSYPLWSYLPLRILYNIFDVARLVALLPYWILTSAIPDLRPLPQWTFKQTLMSRILRAAFHKKAVIGITESHSLKPGKEGDRFQVIKPFPEHAYLGPMAPAPQAKPALIGATWYPAKFDSEKARSDSLKTVVLHIHGGAFIWGDGRTECSGFLARILQDQGGADFVLSIQYRLSAYGGKNPFPAALQDALTSYLYMVRTLEIPPAKIVLVGDSCGATIAMGLIRYLEEFGSAIDMASPANLPCCAILTSAMIAPLKTAGPEPLSRSAYATHVNYDTDFVPLLTLRWGWQVYAGADIDVKEAAQDPYFTPLGHAFSTSVPLFVSMGEREIFVPENEEWVAQMQGLPSNRVVLNYEEHALHDTFLLGRTLGFEDSARKVNEEWKVIRKHYNPGFAPAHLLQLMSCILEKANQFFQHLDHYSRSGESFSLTKLTTNLTFDIIGAVIMDVNLGAQVTDPSQQGKLIRPFKELVQKVVIHKQLREIVTQKHIELKEAKTSQTSRTVLALSLQDIKSLKDDVLDETCDQLKTLLFAGHDTTSVLLDWTYYELSRTPHARREVDAELSRLFGPDTDPMVISRRLLSTEAGDLIHRMPLYTGLFATTPEGRFCLDGNYLYINHTIIRRDPAIYGSTANDFVPELWISDTNSGENAESFVGDSTSFPPEARIIIAMTVRHYDFTKIGRGEMLRDEGCPILNSKKQYEVKSELYSTFQITAKPADGMIMKVRYRGDNEDIEVFTCSLVSRGSLNCVALSSAQAQGPYQPTWESTDKHNASPEWFRDAKFGVYWHWGAFTTPQFGNEWYGRNMYLPNSNERANHIRRYGQPEEWGYQNFIVGAPDLQGRHVQFKPVLASEGGSWDPEAWIRTVKASGARFAGPVAEHHDGFSMWDSKVNEWNSVALGPQLDLAKLFARLVRENGMKLLVAMHQAFNTNGFFSGAPKQTDPSLQKLYGQLPRNVSDQLWFDKQREILDHVQPDIIWNDFSLNSPGYCLGAGDHCSIDEKQRLKFLAYYFNRGVEWNKEVLTTYKHFDTGFRDTSAVGDWERGGPAELTRPYWLTDDAISATSWSYTDGIRYYSSTQMIHSLLDRVSKNGNMLLNISPTAAGILPAEQERVLLDIGAYLGRYGESIYSTRAWDIYGEGPNKAGGGSFTTPLVGNSSDIRFTRNKSGDVLFVTVLGWPSSGKVSVKSFGSANLVSLTGLRSIQLLGDKAGDYIKVADWTQESAALEISLPVQPAASQAYVLKLNFNRHIPVPQIPFGASLFTANGPKGKGVSLPVGNFSTVFLVDAGLAPADIRFLRVSSNTVVTGYSGVNLTGKSTRFGAGEHKIAPKSLASFGVARS